jgi:hypothetical protein
MTIRTKQLLLAGLGGLWAVLLLVRAMTETEPAQAPLRFTSGQRPGTNIVSSKAVDDLHVKPRHPQGRDLPATPKRNIFVSVEKPQIAAVVKPKAVAPAVAIPVAPPVAPVVAAPPPAPPQPSPEELAALAARQRQEQLVRQLREQMAQYRYLGYLRQDGQQRAFLGKGPEIYIIRQGDMLEDKFLVAGIEAHAVTLKEGEYSLEATLELKKDKTGGPS